MLGFNVYKKTVQRGWESHKELGSASGDVVRRLWSFVRSVPGSFKPPGAEHEKDLRYFENVMPLWGLTEKNIGRKKRNMLYKAGLHFLTAAIFVAAQFWARPGYVWMFIIGVLQGCLGITNIWYWWMAHKRCRMVFSRWLKIMLWPPAYARWQDERAGFLRQASEDFLRKVSLEKENSD